MNTWKVTKNSGFTVIELMIVVIIVAVLTALAYPSYTQSCQEIKKGRGTAVADELVDQPGNLALEQYHLRFHGRSWCAHK